MVKCSYCGDVRDDLIRIPSPNMDDTYWNVCVTCNEVLGWQRQLSFGGYMAGMDDAFSRDYGRKRMKEAQENLDRIARESKVPILSAQISKTEDGSYDSMSVEYTGKGDGNDV
jgi:hypothetical protein